MISVDIAIHDYDCASCDGHACNDSPDGPSLGVSVHVLGRRLPRVERRLLRYLVRHIAINGDEPPPRSVDGRRWPFKRFNG